MNYILLLQLQIQLLTLRVQLLQAQLSQQLAIESMPLPAYQGAGITDPPRVEVRVFKAYPVSDTAIKIEGWVSATSSVNFKIGRDLSTRFEWATHGVIGGPNSIFGVVLNLPPGNKFRYSISASPYPNAGPEVYGPEKEVWLPCTADQVKSKAYYCPS